MRHNSDEIIAEEASRWLARHDRGFRKDEEEEFAAWKAADPRCAAEFARLASAWEGFGMAKTSADLAAMARELKMRTDTRSFAPRRMLLRWTWPALAAAAIAAAVGVWKWRESAVPEKVAAGMTHQVIPSAARKLVLEDGSVAELRGASEIQAQFAPAERRIRLLRGEAYFTVTKNPDRPFIVAVGEVTVRAVGTAFSVRMNDLDVKIVVTEGKVSVTEAGSGTGPANVGAAGPGSAPIVAAGQRAVVELRSFPGTPTGVKVEILAPAEMNDALSWKDTWLVFDRTPLAEAVAAFNRHGNQRLILTDPALQGRQLGGKFRADHVEGFIRLLEQTMHLRAERRNAHEIVLVPAL